MQQVAFVQLVKRASGEFAANKNLSWIFVGALTVIAVLQCASMRSIGSLLLNFLSILLSFSWLKFTAMGNRVVNNDHLFKNFWTFFLNFLCLEFVLIVVGGSLGIGWFFYSLHSAKNSGTDDSGIGALAVFAIPMMIAGGIPVFLLLLRLSFVLPAAAYEQTVSFALSWRQSKGWFWRKLFPIFGMYVLWSVSMGFIHLCLSSDTAGKYLSVMTFSYLNLFVLTYIAHVYLEASGLQKPDLSAIKSTTQA